MTSGLGTAIGRVANVRGFASVVYSRAVTDSSRKMLTFLRRGNRPTLSVRYMVWFDVLKKLL